MNESDFYELFSRKMRGLPPPEGSEDDWPALAGRLDAFDRRRLRRQVGAWTALLAALLLLSNGLWWWYWQHSMGALEKRWAEWQEQQVTVASPPDTVIQREIVYRYDTLYRTIYLRERGWITDRVASAGPDLDEARRTAFDDRPDAGENGASGRVDQVNHESILIPPGARPRQQESIAGAWAPFATWPLAGLPVAASDFLPTGGPPYRLPAMDPIMQPADAPVKEPLLIPRSFRLDVAGGALIPLAGGISDPSGYAFSAAGAIGFTDALSLVVEGAYGGLLFRSYTLDNKLGLPPIVPPGDDYFLKYLETHEAPKPVVRAMAGMQYRWNRAGALRPVLGVGYASLFQPGYRLEVEFADRRHGGERSEELYIPAADRPLSYLDFRFGLDWSVARRWSLGVTGVYELKLGKTTGIPAFLGLQGGLAYSF